IYIGTQRIVSKLGDVGSFGVDPRREEYAGSEVSGTEMPDYASKYKALQEVVKDEYKGFEVPYLAVDNDDYVNGEGFCCGDEMRTKSTLPADNVDYEKLQYYYHPDHLGSASYITNLDGEVVQHIEYVPFGEVFLEERNNTWNTPYLFNGKELDEETGLYYYGARYYNPRASQFLSTDRFAEKYPYASPYQYCLNNPINAIDVNGDSVLVNNVGGILDVQKDNNGELIDKNVYQQNDDGGYVQIGELGGNIDISTIMDNKLAETREEAKSMGMLEYGNTVRGGKKWDLKANKETIFGVAWEYSEEQKISTIFSFYQYEGLSAADVGNYHAGYAGRYTGILRYKLLKGAGVAETTKALGNWQFKEGFKRLGQLLNPFDEQFGDRAEDYKWNTQGMNDAASEIFYNNMNRTLTK
ncbi:MAG: RHS repeat-associated core domain-containing protein, partial [Bacteroidales bacterium]